MIVEPLVTLTVKMLINTVIYENSGRSSTHALFLQSRLLATAREFHFPDMNHIVHVDAGDLGVGAKLNTTTCYFGYCFRAHYQ